MKIILFSRPEINHTAAEVSALLDMLSARGFQWRVNGEFAEKIASLTGENLPLSRRYDSIDEYPDAQMIICYGGDGTFLEAVRRSGDTGIPVLGINSGRLGFLANVPKENVARALDDILAGEYTVEGRTMLMAEGDFATAPDYPFAFNEFTLQRDGAGMIAVEVYVNDEMVGRYWGDGVILSTPAGSTAYNLSVGGPVVAPLCQCFVISPIAPHNLTMRPVVIPDSAEVAFRVNTRDEKAYVTLDSSTFSATDGAVFRVKRSKNSVFLVHLRNISFYDTLRNKMLWGFDRRDEP